MLINSLITSAGLSILQMPDWGQGGAWAGGSETPGCWGNGGKNSPSIWTAPTVCWALYNLGLCSFAKPSPLPHETAVGGGGGPHLLGGNFKFCVFPVLPTQNCSPFKPGLPPPPPPAFPKKDTEAQGGDGLLEVTQQEWLSWVRFVPHQSCSQNSPEEGLRCQPRI